MADYSNLSPFQHIQATQFEAALEQSTTSTNISQRAKAIQDVAAHTLGKSNSTLNVGIRTVSLEKLSNLLSISTGLPKEAIAQLLQSVRQKHEAFGNSEDLLKAIKSAKEVSTAEIDAHHQSIQDAIATISKAKELFNDLKHIRFVGRSQETSDAYPFGANWAGSQLFKFLEENPEKNTLVKKFYDGLSDKNVIPNPNTLNHFFTEILGTYIKLDRNNKVVTVPANHAKIENFLSHHPELVTFINDNKTLLAFVNKEFADDVLVNKLSKDTSLNNELREFTATLATPDLTEKEKVTMMKNFVKELINDRNCSKKEKAAFEEFYQTLLNEPDEPSPILDGG